MFGRFAGCRARSSRAARIGSCTLVAGNIGGLDARSAPSRTQPSCSDHATVASSSWPRLPTTTTTTVSCIRNAASGFEKHQCQLLWQISVRRGAVIVGHSSSTVIPPLGWRSREPRLFLLSFVLRPTVSPQHEGGRWRMPVARSSHSTVIHNVSHAWSGLECQARGSRRKGGLCGVTKHVLEIQTPSHIAAQRPEETAGECPRLVKAGRSNVIG